MIKTQIIKIRVSVLDRELIKINANKAGLSVSQYMIDCAIHRVIIPPPSEEMKEAYTHLANYKRNFTYISNLIKNRNAPELAYQIMQLTNQISEHLDYIKNGKQSSIKNGE